MFLRPIRSEAEDHTKRPNMFVRERKAANPAAVTAIVVVLELSAKKSL